MAVGANQPTLLEDLRTFFADPDERRTRCTVAREARKGQGRLETRVLWATDALVGYTAWPGLAQGVCLERTRQHLATGQTERETAYAVTSLAPTRAGPRRLLRLWRGHWTIENRVHWVRDVCLGEDAAPVRAGAGPQVLAALRNTVLNVLRAHGYRQVTTARRRLARSSHHALALLGLP